MITIGSTEDSSSARVTRTCKSEFGFSYRELRQEAVRRGYSVRKDTRKEVLMEKLCEHKILHHKDFIAYSGYKKIVVEELDGNRGTRREKSFPFNVRPVGVT